MAMLNNQMVGHFKQGPILLSTILLPTTCAWSIRKWTTLKTWATTSTSKDPLLLCPFCWDVGLNNQLLSLRFWATVFAFCPFWEHVVSFSFHQWINGGWTWLWGLPLGIPDFQLRAVHLSGSLWNPATEQSRNSTEVFSKYGKVVRLKVMEPTGENVDCAALVQMYPWPGQKRDIMDSAINGHAWVNIISADVRQFVQRMTSIHWRIS